MKTKTLFVFAFVLLAIAQWAVPFRLISKFETIIINGKELKFELSDVYPKWPKGENFINIGIAENKYVTKKTAGWESNEDIFVILTQDTADKYNLISAISKTKPAEDVAYVKAKVMYVDKDTIRIKYAFDRYYMDESLVADAIQWYKKEISDSSKVCYATVRVIEGETALTDLILNGKSVKELNKPKK